MVLRELELQLKMGLDLADSYRDTPGNHLGKMEESGKANLEFIHAGTENWRRY